METDEGIDIGPEKFWDEIYVWFRLKGVDYTTPGQSVVWKWACSESTSDQLHLVSTLLCLASAVEVDRRVA